MTDVKDAATKSLAVQQDRNQVKEVTDKVLAVKKQLQDLTPQLKSAMLARVKPDYLISVATTVLRLRPELQECTALSIISSIFQSAQAGLSLDPVLKHAALVKRWNSKTKTHEAQFMPMYSGYLELARRSGEIISIVAQLVYEKDYFEREYGNNEHLTHRPELGERGKTVGAYAYARLKGGGFISEYMTVLELDAIMMRSSSKDKEGHIVGPWKTDQSEMRRKTVVRRLSKYLPLTTELKQVVEADEVVAAGGTQVLTETAEIIADYTPLPGENGDTATTDPSPEPKALPEGSTEEKKDEIGAKETATLKKLISEAKSEPALKSIGKTAKTWFDEGRITEAQHDEVKNLLGGKK